MAETLPEKVSGDLRIVAPGHEGCGFKDPDTYEKCPNKATILVTITSGSGVGTMLFMCAKHSESAKEEWLKATFVKEWS